MLYAILRQNFQFVGYRYYSGCQKYSLLCGPVRAKVRSQNSSRGVRAKALMPPPLLTIFLTTSD